MSPNGSSSRASRRLAARRRSGRSMAALTTPSKQLFTEGFAWVTRLGFGMATHMDKVSSRSTDCTILHNPGTLARALRPTGHQLSYASIPSPSFQASTRTSILAILQSWRNKRALASPRSSCPAFYPDGQFETHGPTCDGKAYQPLCLATDANHHPPGTATPTTARSAT